MNTNLIRKLKRICIAAIVLSMMATSIHAYAASHTIYNNGFNGIYIDIDSGYYKQYTSVPTWGQYAYTTEGCAWFASARVRELTGKGTTIWDGNSWWNNYSNCGFTRGTTLNKSTRALVCWTGHVAVIEGFTSDGKIIVSEGGVSVLSYVTAAHGYCHITTYATEANLKREAGTTFLGYVYINISPVNEVRGKEMTSGYDRVLPDGDYMIAHAGDTSFYLDIQGYTVPAANGTNVQLYQTETGEITDSDAWTITYSNEFYRIAQYGQEVSLDVSEGDTLRGKNVQAWKNSATASAQKWAVSRNGKNGYRLEAKCSGYSLDIQNGTIAKKTNIWQYADNTTNAQSWLFIPYKPSQPVAEGRYVLLYTPNQSYEMDVKGDTADVADGTNVQLWSDTTSSRYNSFNITKLSNGYYKFTHAASGKCLTVTGGSTAYKANVEIRADNGSASQQWAIISNGAGYSVISKANGYAIDLPDGTTGDGKNLQVYPRTEGSTQRWTFVQAEHTVRFNANGGTNAPAAVTKYYKINLTLPSTVPTRTGYKFLGWSASSGAASPSYSAGGTYTADNDVTLYAVWEPLSYTLSFDMNGGTGSLDPIHVNGSSCTIPNYTPQRTGYDFLGWSTNKSATTASYHAGDIYQGGTATLYAVWKIRTYVVSFDSAGAGSYNSITVNHGATVSLPVPKKQGFLFKGWYSSDNTRVMNSTVIVTNLSLTARWSEPTRMTLPESLTAIEDESFAGTAPNVVIIPEVTGIIGPRAFADNEELYSVVVYCRTQTLANDAFENCPNLTVYGYRNSSIDTYCTRLGIPFVALDDASYILNDALPVGAVVTDEKWTYTLSTTQTTTSAETSLSGWTNTGNYSWEKTGTGTYKYASYPSGFDTGNSLYSKYNKSKLSSSSTETTKREAGSESFLTYIYWHWTFVDSVSADHASGGHNVFIRDARLLHENISGSVYRDFIYFDAFETTESQGTVGPRNATGTYDIGTEGGYYFWRNNDADASQWWWRFNVYQQTYTDYRKLFTYTRTVTENKESATQVVEGNGISNVKHLVRYSF